MREPSLRDTMNLSDEYARESNWKAASELLRKSYDLAASERECVEISEKLAYAIYRAARQSDDVRDFHRGAEEAAKEYIRTIEHAERLEAPRTEGARLLRCEAMLEHISSFLALKVSEKKAMLAKSWSLAVQAMNVFRMTGDSSEHWRTLSQLSLSSVLSVALETTGQGRVTILREGLDHAEEALRNLSTLSSNETARACACALFYMEMLRDLLPSDEFEKLERTKPDYWEKGRALSERAALLELANLGWPNLQNEGENIALGYWRKTLRYCRRTCDRLLIGHCLNSMAYLTAQKGQSSETSDQGRVLLKKALQYAEESKLQFGKIGFRSYLPVWWVEAAEVCYYYVQARYFETSLDEKRSLLERALKLCPEFLRLAEESGYPEVVSSAHLTYGGVLNLLGGIEPTIEGKRSLLSQALEHRLESGMLVDELIPYHYWNRGVAHFVAGENRALLADFPNSVEDRRKQLTEGIRECEEAILLCQTHALLWEKDGQTSQFSTLGMGHFRLAALLLHHYDLTGKKAILRRTVESYREASKCYAKVDNLARVAECNWAAGRTLETLQDYQEAAQVFGLAGQGYQKAAERTVNLHDFYTDYSSYMRAWSEIEKAKYHHEKERYGIAKEHYEKASTLHESTKSWNYLASNYLAWARLESAEDSSRNEESEAAIDHFEEASRLFQETQRVLQNQGGLLKGEEDKTLSANLASAARSRGLYCVTRIALERAKVLDKAGEHMSAAEKYEEAANGLDALVRESASAEERREFELIAALSRAWKTVAKAEAEASPKFFIQASKLFTEAKRITSNESSKMLALGHRNLCRALAAGTSFANTMDMAQYELAQEHLEGATNFYLKGGFLAAGENARASKLLLDAYVYVHDANRERDPERKLRLFAMAEKVLNASAESYSRAKQPGKATHVEKLVEKVRREKELALSLNEIFHAPGMITNTVAFAPPKPTHQTALGIERFDEGMIHATVRAGQEDVRVGQEFHVEIELFNAGRGLAQLVRLEEAIPAGFEVAEIFPPYRVDGTNLDPRGRRLGPLKIEKVRVGLRPRQHGRVSFKPRILYVSESGKYLSSEAEPLELTVSAGVSLLSSKEDLDYPSSTLPKSEPTKMAFDYLVREFTRDYMEKRLNRSEAGWRSLMDMVRELDLPKRAFYGEGGGRGRVLRELERRGLVETRIFPEQRGRGGEVKRIRVAYENEVVKRLVEISVRDM